MGNNDYLDNAFYLYGWGGLRQRGIVNEVFDPFKYTLEISDSCMYNKETLPHSGDDVIGYMRDKGFISLHNHGGPAAIMTCHNHSKDKFIIALNSYTHNHELGPWVYDDAEETSRGIDGMKNKNKPGILYTLACETAPFDDYITLDSIHFNISYNMGQAYTMAGDYGGVAYLGNTRSGRFGPSTDMEKIWGEQTLLNPKLGVSECLSKKLYAEQSGSDIKTRHNLIGEPEFEMWLGKPRKLNINLVPNVSGVEIQGNVADSTYCVLSNGKNYSIKHFATGNQYSNPYPAEYCFSLWRTGYLPIITLFGQKGTLAEAKRYIVRNAFLGNVSSDASDGCSYSVVHNGNLYVRAIDEISTYGGFSIENGGVVEFDCEQTVNLNGGIIRKGGKLIIHAKDVKMGAGFKVEAGGILQILN